MVLVNPGIVVSEMLGTVVMIVLGVEDEEEEPELIIPYFFTF